MIQHGTCVPVPGLFKATGVYALATGVLSPQVIVDPIIRGKPGEQALVAHEVAHVEGRHALKYIIMCGVALFLACFTLLLWLARGPLLVPNTTLVCFAAATALWTLFIPQALRRFEIEADEAALARTSPADFVAFVHIHAHPKGRWGRWLYGANTGDRISRVLP